MITVTKKDLIELGYGNSFSADIIKKTKELMISKGHTYCRTVHYFNRCKRLIHQTSPAKKSVEIQCIEWL